MNALQLQGPLRISHPEKEGVLRASKWLKHPVLLDEEEMVSLFEALGDFSIYLVSAALEKDKIRVSKQDFLSKYSLYIRALKQGAIPEEASLRPYFSAIFTVTSDVLYAMEVSKEKYLVKSVKPVIQLQAHHFLVSSVDGKFHSMVLSKDSISWGIQFSYPQIFEDPRTHEFFKVIEGEHFPNTALFSRLSKWLRGHTLPTPFLRGEERVNVPIRIGKACLDWIPSHPQLMGMQLKICPIGKK